jgi:hypothetical protein
MISNRYGDADFPEINHFIFTVALVNSVLAEDEIAQILQLVFR